MARWMEHCRRCDEIIVKIMSRAGELADEDSDAFDEVMASFKLPKGVMKKLQLPSCNWKCHIKAHRKAL